MQSRVLVTGFDRSANKEIAGLLSQKRPGIVITSEHEFQKALDTGDKYAWLSILIDMEEVYHTDIIVLWYGDNDRKKSRANPNNKLLLQYCNEILFVPYSNKKLFVPRTRIYIMDVTNKLKLSENAEIINNYLGKEDITTFETDGLVKWTYPYEFMELVKI